MRNAATRRPRFLERVFTEAERLHIEQGGMMKWARAAGKFAAKEAIAKAFGRSFYWHEVEILPDGGGAPNAALHGRAAEAGTGRRLLVSVSHCREYAAAVAILEELPQESPPTPPRSARAT